MNISKRFSTLAASALLIVPAAFAQKISVQNVELVNGTATVSVVLDTEGQEFSGMQTAIVLPEGLEKDDIVLGDACVKGHKDYSSEVITNVAGTSKTLLKNGTVFTFELTASEGFESGEINFTKIKFSNGVTQDDFSITVTATNPNDPAYETFDAEYRNLQSQYTQVYNSTILAEAYQSERYAEIVDSMSVMLNGIYQNIENLQTWANESYEAGTLYTDLDEILSNFEEQQIHLTQFMNAFQNAIDEFENNSAAEQFMAEYESLSQQWTMVYNSTVMSEEYAGEEYAAVIEDMTANINAIYQNMATKQTWAEESMNAGTLAADLDEILASFEEIQIQLTQFINTFYDAVAEIATSVSNVTFSKSVNGKFVKNGKVVIVKNGVEYAVSGAPVK